MKKFINSVALVFIITLSFNALAEITLKSSVDTKPKKSKKEPSRLYSPAPGIHMDKSIKFKSLGKVRKTFLESFVDKKRNVVCYYFRQVSDDSVGAMECLPL